MSVEVEHDESLVVRWFMLYKEYAGEVHRNECEDVSKRKRIFYDAQSIIQQIQTQQRLSKEEIGRGFILADGIVYEVSNSNPHLKITGELARDVKRHISGKKLFFS